MEEFINRYDVIIFDCDGVLLDTNLLKCEAFGDSIEGYSKEIKEKFVSHCRETFGISRYIKFKDFFEKFAEEPFQENKYNKFLIKYGLLCKEIYKSATITPGAEELLKLLTKESKEIYIASGSDEGELREVFNDRRLDVYFDGIYGSPKNKVESTSLILSERSQKRIVFIGDALSDMEAAKKCNIDFIYMSMFSVQSKKKEKICQSGSVKVIKTLEELL